MVISQIYCKMIASGAGRPLTNGGLRNMAKQTTEKAGPPYKGGSPAKAHTGAVPNKVFAATDQGFRAKCDAAGVQPTARQASKYRRGIGSAYRFKA